jgi:hypothetical protein
LPRRPDTVEVYNLEGRLVLLSRGLRSCAVSSSRDEEASVPRPIEPWLADDDLSRRRRAREARLLAQPVAGAPGLTVADVVADVLAESDEGRIALDVPDYLANCGYTAPTIDAVVGWLRRQRPTVIADGARDDSDTIGQPATVLRLR